MYTIFAAAAYVVIGGCLYLYFYLYFILVLLLSLMNNKIIFLYSWFLISDLSYTFFVLLFFFFLFGFPQDNFGCVSNKIKIKFFNQQKI